jgi:hypothetical protein
MDLNHRRFPVPDLQSGAFDQLGHLPTIIAILNWSRRWDSNPQPADYKSAALPIELRRHFSTAEIILT